MEWAPELLFRIIAYCTSMDPNQSFSEAALAAFAKLEAGYDETGATAEGQIAGDPRLAEELARLRGLRNRVGRLLHGLLEDPAAVRSALDSLGLATEVGNAELEAELARLSRFRGADPRYAIEGEIARGGMSTVFRVRDQALGRELAMKVAHGRAGVPARFLDEARLTGRLEHPGIVPVHDLCVDADGRACFTMPLVRGRTFTEAIDLARQRCQDWTLARALEALLKVCDTVAYAHSLGVVHRDLKPDNVLVGRFGEVYVVDWGLARQNGAAQDTSAPDSGVEDEVADRRTQAGAVLGTPAYMAPEQAAGRHGDIGPRSDVYALGAILYRLLSGVAPYCEGAERPSGRAVLEAARNGPPTDIERLEPAADVELASICRKAMQRDPESRYAAVEEMSADLRAYLDGRVVRAHPVGAWAQLRKWVRRNRALAGAAGAGLFLLIAGLAGVSWSESRRVAQLERTSARVRFESHQRAPAALRAAAATLWPAVPARIPDLENWLRQARELVAWREGYALELEELMRTGRVSDPMEPRAAAERRRLEAQVAALRSEAAGQADDVLDMSARAFGPGRDQGLAYANERIDLLIPRIATLELHIANPRVREYDEPARDQQHVALVNLLDAIDELADPYEGLVADVEARLERARSMPDRTAMAADPAWHEAIADIADPARSPHYRGLRIEPQVGLAPLRRNPRSGLWEFHALASGERPRALDDGGYAMGPTAGIVLVLIPGGTTRLGARALDPLPTWSIVEGHAPAGPLREVDLEPYFLAKHEMTQGQWLLCTRRNPAYFHAGTTFTWPTHTLSFDLSYPVESISWKDARETLGRLGLLLPTEARLEHAYRAGTEGRWSLPDAPWCLASGINAMHDLASPMRFDLGVGYLPFDGFHSPAPVGWFSVNPWGLHDVYGNVGEWALDVFWSRYEFDLRDGDGLHLAPESGLRPVRGGTWGHPIQHQSSWHREDQKIEFRSLAIGVRAARDVSR